MFIILWTLKLYIKYTYRIIIGNKFRGPAPFPKNVFVFKPIVTYLMTLYSQLIPNSFNFSFFLDLYMLNIYHALCLTKPTKTELQVLN